MRESDYRVSAVVKDLFAFWQDAGYVRGKRGGKAVLVKVVPGEVVVKPGKFRTVSESKDAFVQRAGRGRQRISLRETFGGALKKADYAVVGGRRISPTAADRVEVTRLRLTPGSTVPVVLVRTVREERRVKEKDRKDVISTTELEYALFAEGVYTPRGAPPERQLGLGTFLRLKVGVRAPFGANEPDFWNKVYASLESTVLDEILEKADEELSGLVNYTVASGTVWTLEHDTKRGTRKEGTPAASELLQDARDAG